MKISESGQVTIPKALRDLFGFTPGTTLDVEVNRNGILIKPAGHCSDDVMRWLKEEHGDELATLTSAQIAHMIQ